MTQIFLAYSLPLLPFLLLFSRVSYYPDWPCYVANAPPSSTPSALDMNVHPPCLASLPTSR